MKMALLTIGIIGKSLKENECRVPIHPEHLNWISDEIREHLIFERGYGLPFGVADESIASRTGGLANCDEILKHCDVVLMPKPVEEDFQKIKESGILWGWVHCVQQKNLTQIAIERRLTLIAWEAMHKWGTNGKFQMHIFQKNNEIAGYAGVLDALRLIGVSGHYGPTRKAIVLSFGSVSRGAIFALQGLGFNDITVFTQRPTYVVGSQNPNVVYLEIGVDESGCLVAVEPDGSLLPFIEELASADIIVNGILQDTDNPLMFVKENEVDRLKPGCLIIDISCDEGMGFPFARPTTFENPILKVGKINYYAVDHTPSYLWNSASWEISKSLLPFLPVVMAGSEHWYENETIGKAIEISSGIIQNSKIISFQKRSPEYPHSIITN